MWFRLRICTRLHPLRSFEDQHRVHKCLPKTLIPHCVDHNTVKQLWTRVVHRAPHNIIPIYSSFYPLWYSVISFNVFFVGWPSTQNPQCFSTNSLAWSFSLRALHSGLICLNTTRAPQGVDLRSLCIFAFFPVFVLEMPAALPNKYRSVFEIHFHV